MVFLTEALSHRALISQLYYTLSVGYRLGTGIQYLPLCLVLLPLSPTDPPILNQS